MLFTSFWQPHKIKILYNGKKIDLTPEQEEMTIYWTIKKLINNNIEEK